VSSTNISCGTRARSPAASRAPVEPPARRSWWGELLKLVIVLGAVGVVS